MVTLHMLFFHLLKLKKKNVISLTCENLWKTQYGCDTTDKCNFSIN